MLHLHEFAGNPVLLPHRAQGGGASGLWAPVLSFHVGVGGRIAIVMPVLTFWTLTSLQKVHQLTNRVIYYLEKLMTSLGLLNRSSFPKPVTGLRSDPCPPVRVMDVLARSLGSECARKRPVSQSSQEPGSLLRILPASALLTGNLSQPRGPAVTLVCGFLPYRVGPKPLALEGGESRLCWPPLVLENHHTAVPSAPAPAPCQQIPNPQTGPL